MSGGNTNHRSRTLYKSVLKRSLIVIVPILLAVYGLLPNIGGFNESFSTIAHADLALICLAAVLVAATYLAASATYCFLAYFKLKYWRTVLVQIADGFTNRLLPAGAGGLATSALYLIKQGHNKTKAGYVAGLNNLVGFTGHILLLLILMIFNPRPVRNLFMVHISNRTLILLALIVFSTITAFMALWRLRRITRRAINSITQVIAYAFGHPIRLALALASSVAITSCYSLALYGCALALNAHLSILQIFMVLTVGVLSSIVTPTPGGVGGVEAGLTASMIAVGINAHQALSVALVYRLITYWLPILPGFVALQIVLNKKYLALS